jgi:hypothetical protein
MACPSIVAHITKADACPRCGRIRVFYSPECVEGVFYDVRLLVSILAALVEGGFSTP